jgi:hypothetical protein
VLQIICDVADGVPESAFAPVDMPGMLIPAMSPSACAVPHAAKNNGAAASSHTP